MERGGEKLSLSSSSSFSSFFSFLCLSIYLSLFPPRMSSLFFRIVMNEDSKYGKRLSERKRVRDGTPQIKHGLSLSQREKRAWANRERDVVSGKFPVSLAVEIAIRGVLCECERLDALRTRWRRSFRGRELCSVLGLLLWILLWMLLRLRGGYCRERRRCPLLRRGRQRGWPVCRCLELDLN